MAEYRCVYTDTDSIVVEAEGFKKLLENPNSIIDDNKLGSLKVEHKLGYFKAVSPKCYMMISADGKSYDLKIKGVGNMTKNIEEAIEMWKKYIQSGEMEF